MTSDAKAPYTEFVERAARAMRTKRVELLAGYFSSAGTVPAWDAMRPETKTQFLEETKAAMESLVTPPNDLIARLAYEHDLTQVAARSLWHDIFASIVEG